MHTQVLIAGAGPTGLMMACQLRLMGISCMVLDTKEGPTVESRALVVQARTLEIYQQMGIADEAVNDGAITSKVRLTTTKGVIATVPFTNLGKGLSQFPHMLVYEQNKNEELLYKYLKEHDGDVLWRHELISFTQDAQQVTAEVKNATGDIQNITADYLIGADGASSKVRHQLGLSFEGDTYEHIFYVADIALPDDAATWTHEGLNLYFSRDAFLGLFPMQGKDRFRAIGILPEAYQDEHPKSFSPIAPLIEASVKLPLHFKDTRWFSVYRLHHRRVDEFRAGRIFLCGDAAHIHSPAGGQGMNTGLQDAYNLAWKLSFVLNGQAKEDILDSYQQERLPIAKMLMVTTDRAFSIMTGKKWFQVFLRTMVIPYIVPLALRIDAFKRFMFRTVSQIEISYEESMLTGKAQVNSKLKAGMRFPYVQLTDGTSLYDRMPSMKYHLLVFADIKKREDIKAMFNAPFNKLLDIVFVEEPESRIALSLKEDALILVRPDHYIACSVNAADARLIEAYLLQIYPNTILT